MAQFIEQDGDPQLPPPYRFPNISCMSFRLPADQNALQALCDKFLNVGSRAQRGFEYRALFNFVDLEILTYPRMECLSPPFANNGFTTQHEIYFRFLVQKLVVTSNMLIPALETANFFPFIFVDNPWSVIDGREVIGFPKNLATFEFLGDPYPIRVSTQVFTQYGANEQLQPKPFIEIRAATKAGKAPALTNWPWGMIDVSYMDPLIEELRQLIGPRMFTIHLKQFRDPQNITRACYQALVEAEFSASNLANAALLPACEVVLTPAASLPLATALGLGGNTVLPLSQYRQQFDMDFGNVRNLYVVP
jgi:acetoacetate decarboxylase